MTKKRIEWARVAESLVAFRKGEEDGEALRQLNRWLGAELQSVGASGSNDVLSLRERLEELAKEDPVVAELGLKIAPRGASPVPRCYQDFRIQFSSSKDGVYRTRAEALGFESSACFKSPWTEDSLQEWLERAVQTLASGVDEASRHVRDESVSEFDSTVDFEADGRKLFNALLAGDLRRHYDSCLGRLRDAEPGLQSRGLRIKICLDTKKGSHRFLDQLPWEMIWDQSALALGDQMLITRYLEQSVANNAVALHPPLRVLIVQSYAGGEPLDLEEEWRAIEDSWSSVPRSNVAFDFLHDPNPAAIENALDRCHYHVLHFMGHGSVDRGTGRGCLELIDRSGAERSVSGRLLGDLLRRHDSLRLVVLNSCESSAFERAQPSSRNPSGVAQELVTSGCPAVVAMQFPVADTTAILFAQTFYQALVDGLPVDAAVARGRMAIRMESESSWQWITPVVYMRLKDGYLFRP